MPISKVLSNLTRKKTLESDILKTPLQRCLSTTDLTFLGLAQMIGGGIYVLGGAISNSTAGPGVILSFLIAGLAAFLSALCYAEFGSLIPRTGSAYLFCYVILGEAVAFTAGWAIVSEQVIGMAATARSFSATLDGVFAGWVQNKTVEAFGRFGISWLSPYPDFLSLVPIFLINGVVISGVKNTALIGNALTFIKILVLILITVVGFTRANFENWQNVGKGGFLPFGIGGVFSGAAYCFFAYVGFDSVAIAGEEALTPRKSIPKALIISISIVCSLYVLSSCSLTLMQPYYEIDRLIPYQHAFIAVGLSWANYIVTIGSLLALSTTIMCGMYATARIIYAMASDGMVFAFLGRINSFTKTPLNASIASTILAALLALFINMETLVELFSIVTLLAFTLVALALLKFHYLVPDNSPLFQSHLILEDESRLIDTKASTENIGTLRPIASYIPFASFIASYLPVDVIITAMVTSQVIFGLFGVVGYHTIGIDNWCIIVFMVLFGSLALVSFLLLALHHTNNYTSGFRLPFSPLPETLSISINLALMFMLKPMTWARFSVWLLIGGVLYCLYGARYSKENASPSLPLIEPTTTPLSESEGTVLEYHTLNAQGNNDQTSTNYGTIETSDN